MALTKEKNITLVGHSTINGTEVARFNAQIATDLNAQTTTNTYIYNQELYRKNLKQVRDDSDEFRSYVRSQEDEAFKELTEETIEE
ncbi:hypothetical protein LTY36_04990 [Limosilactobacillus agrestis]|uniref:Uncharacterized protein n=1 Tax=Limosilactobacillus agrestis TaxID=2759748 RepID=A0ABS8R9J7_9LACO|nr:hypothetical protein [Limosilactobacillus agrestis]MCD7130546.1 hypothetical protein [Limosilactobacillus agrestis]